MPIRRGLLALATSVLLCTGCAYNPMVQEFIPLRHTTGPERLVELKGMSTVPPDLGENEEQVYQQVKKYAYQVGFAEGVYGRYREIMNRLSQVEIDLDRAWAFSDYVLDGKLLLPVVYETRELVQQLDSRTLSRSRVVYTLGKPSRLVTNVPSWRDYLYADVAKPRNPDELFLPRTRAERDVWRDELDKGWADGVEEADLVFARNVARLERDIYGHKLFLALHEQRIVGMPAVGSDKQGVVSEGSDLSVGQEIWTIIVDETFTSTDQWAPVFSADFTNFGKVVSE